ncbi:hypothetical protein [Elioraea sp.]|uniref:hypothetical protein n=1 Tax=Elioraea sp. TaxID=2185103 RepID=UPI0025C1672A|nr:hypothetical protein [Elioraea sp.]
MRRTKSAAPDAFAAFIAARGAYLAQKTVLDYCAVKLGVNWHNALHDPVFTTPLTACRWRTYLVAQGDVAAMAESWLRPHAPDPALLVPPLAAIVTSAIATVGVPEAFAPEAEAATAAILPKLARLQLGPTHEPTTLPLDSAPVLLATLPIHPDLRKGENVSILGALRMHLVSAHQDMQREFDPAALAAALVARQP